jgi:hypothetical protein
MTVGETMTGSIDLKNSGTLTWPAGVVKLAPIPRDQASDFQSPSWLSSTRVSTISADVAPGQVGHFEWDLTPSQSGTFAPYFGLVAEGMIWFADSGGPPDNDIQVSVVVAPAPAGAGGTGTGTGGTGNPTTGAGGSGNPTTGAGGSGNPTTGAGGSGNPTTGAGGSGTGGSKSGTGGTATATGQGGTASGSVGGTSNGAGGVVATGGASNANGGAGQAGAQAVDFVNDDSNSGSSGTCAVGTRSAPAPYGVFGVGLALLALGTRARRRAR